MPENSLKPHYCIGADAELSQPVPISVVVPDRGGLKPICPYFASGKCLAGVPKKDELGLVKEDVNQHPHSSTADAFPDCLYSNTEVVRMT